ncbi:MAG: LemA family protein [Planctomycetota bacterium]|jgi:LemA protein
MSLIGTIVKRVYAEDLKDKVNSPGVNRRLRPTNKVTRGLAAFRNPATRRSIKIWAIRIFVVLFILFVLAEGFFQYNRFASWQTVVLARRADVEREYQRRENLIPNLVVAVSKYAKYEQRMFKHVSDARHTLQDIKGPKASKIELSSTLKKALSGLVALAEQYPDLKATGSVQDLIKEAAVTENRIADAKEKYNKACEIYNQYRTIFPGNVFAFVYQFEAVPYIGLEEDVKVPQIDLNIKE